MIKFFFFISFIKGPIFLMWVITSFQSEISPTLRPPPLIKALYV